MAAALDPVTAAFSDLVKITTDAGQRFVVCHPGHLIRLLITVGAVWLDAACGVMPQGFSGLCFSFGPRE